MENTIKELKAGDTLQNGIYVIERIIGAGGFGITYMARHTRLNVSHAIKEFFINGYCVRNLRNKTVQLQGIDITMYEKYRQKFLEEAQTLTRLDHPNVVKVLNSFIENNTAYMVMPFVEGVTLQQKVTQHSRLSYETAVNYIAQLSEAVGYIHAKDILHRDIKPENIIITPDNRAILIDFGSAREFVQDKTQHHTSILTQGYAPPEQYTTNSRKGAYSDIYSLGAVFYFSLTGQKPMDATTRTMESMPEPQELVPDIPDAANRTIREAMQLKPENRYQTVQDFMNDLLNTEQNPKTKIRDNKKSISITLSPFAIENLQKMASWMKFIAVFLYVIGGIMIVVLLFNFFSASYYEKGSGILGIVFFGFLIYCINLLHQAANKIKSFCLATDKNTMEQGIFYLKKYWKTRGIIFIVYFSLLLLALLIGIIGEIV
ncbi:MAG: protein kinase [Bacteroidales bacterium]|jgi:serine/threonine protein kinase|nr:protein kinase [Bacteroidales bacterium]